MSYEITAKEEFMFGNRVLLYSAVADAPVLRYRTVSLNAFIQIPVLLL